MIIGEAAGESQRQAERVSPCYPLAAQVLNTCASRGAASAAEGWLEEMLERRREAVGARFGEARGEAMGGLGKDQNRGWPFALGWLINR